MATEQSAEAKKISLLIEAWHNARAGFEELLQDAKLEWQKKEAILKKHEYDAEGYPQIKEARDAYFKWIEDHISAYGISMTTKAMTGEPVGLIAHLAGTAI